MLDYRSKKQKANYDAEHANKPFALSDAEIASLPENGDHDGSPITHDWDVHSVGCSARSYNPGPSMPLASDASNGQ